MQTENTGVFQAVWLAACKMSIGPEAFSDNIRRFRQSTYISDTTFRQATPAHFRHDHFARQKAMMSDPPLFRWHSHEMYPGQGRAQAPVRLSGSGDIMTSAVMLHVRQTPNGNVLCLTQCIPHVWFPVPPGCPSSILKGGSLVASRARRRIRPKPYIP